MKCVELLEWKGLVGEVETLPGDSSNVEFLFIFETGDDFRNLTTALLQYNFEIPVLCDTHSEFGAKNLLPDKEILHYFLLDKSNNACLVGSPVNNHAMWQLHKKRIAEINSGALSK